MGIEVYVSPWTLGARLVFDPRVGQKILVLFRTEAPREQLQIGAHITPLSDISPPA